MGLLNRPTLVFLFMLLGILISGKAQEERILDFDVEIRVLMDRSIEVTEHISVYATGDHIKRGYIRSIPIKRDFHGEMHEMRIQVLSVLHDGLPEPFDIANYDIQLAIYTGTIGLPIKKGEHTYTFKYLVHDQVLPFWKYDELTWNVIGTNVELPVERASCTVFLSQGKSLQKYWCYTGRHDQPEMDCIATVSLEGESIRFESRQSLFPHQAFTIGMELEKGIVGHGMLSFYKHIDIALTLGLCLLLLFAYAGITWKLYGVDPPHPAPKLSYKPPAGYSPAVIGYMYHEVFNTKNTTASLLHLAIKGHIKIEEVEREGQSKNAKDYRIRNLYKHPAGLPKEEKRLLSNLLRKAKSYFFNGRYSGMVAHACERHDEAIKDIHQTFVKEGYNRLFLIPPIAGAAGFLGYAIHDLVQQGAYNNFKELYTDWGYNLTGMIAFVPLFITGLLVYAFLIKKPSPQKLDVLAEVKGFKKYLEMRTAARQQLDNPPLLTLAHFEEMLPYAVAFGVEKSWLSINREMLINEAYFPPWCSKETAYMNPRFYTSFSKTTAAGKVVPVDTRSGKEPMIGIIGW